ncbi:MAG: N,N-dimethylformamidase beta subunit family domain-containing protein [Burkholderiaceae bacterium]
MIPLAAYAHRLSIRPEATIRFHVANATGESVKANIVRVICADANPNGPGIVTEAVTSEPQCITEPVQQMVPHGSYALVDGIPRLPAVFTVAVRLMPALKGKPQALISQTNRLDNAGWSLALDADNFLVLRTGDGRVMREVARSSHPLPVNKWAFAWLSIQSDRVRTVTSDSDEVDDTTESDAPSVTVNHARVSLGWRPYIRGLPGDRMSVGANDSVNICFDDKTPLVFAAEDGSAPCQHFNGRLEEPALFSHALTADELQGLATEQSAVIDSASCRWDFSDQPDSDQITDKGPAACHGRLINTPVRAVKGAFWTGRNMVWHQAPDEYGAIHFHDDDIDNCHWPVCYEWTVPAGTRSGIYALMLRAGGHEENVPFHVVPPVGKANARLAVLASTITYTIYGNNARPEWDADPQWQQQWRDQAARWQAYPHNPGDHREYGLSTYNNHPDGSGISIASWHRPMLGMRLGYITYPNEEIRASGLRHFPADSHLIAWLEHKGYEYDIITDIELHEEGVELLNQYQTVLTGSHPEYHTGRMLNALEKYRDSGGRFCYLGGNGFYWKVALKPNVDGVIEIRRGEGGIRAWAAEPGEYYNQFDGEYGGLWRRNGRPPQDLVGVGFTAQGNFSGSYYRSRPDAAQSRAAWILAGIKTETFGNHGFSAHGAAGFELDRADKNLGTPEHAVIIASSENHPPEAPWILVPEEMLTHLLTWPHQPAAELVRADMVFFECAGGGAVFSTGSITFCGSLMTDNFDNDVSRLLQNVVDRFLEPTPFEMPVSDAL